MKLGKNVFVAIASIGIADGEASATEIEALTHAARESGLEAAEVEEIAAIAKDARTTKPALEEVKKLRMTPEERLFAYAIAAWLVRVDGVVMPEEKMALHRFGDVLRLADGDRTQASAASFKVSQLDPSERPKKFDLAALADRIKDDLAASLERGA
jgi:hypothetical protein